MDPNRLKAIPIFSHLSDEEANRLAAFATETSVADGQILMKQGDYSTELIGIEEGTAELDRALRLRRPGPYQLQAAIAALHATAPTADDTDWPQIAALYGRLSCHTGSPVVQVNRAVAVGMAHGPRAGLRVLDALQDDTRLAGYQPFHAARADLLRRAGDERAAAAAYGRAIELSTNAVERDELERRRSSLAAG